MPFDIEPRSGRPEGTDDFQRIAVTKDSEKRRRPKCNRTLPFGYDDIVGNPNTATRESQEHRQETHEPASRIHLSLTLQGQDRSPGRPDERQPAGTSSPLQPNPPGHRTGLGANCDAGIGPGASAKYRPFGQSSCVSLHEFQVEPRIAGINAKFSLHRYGRINGVDGNL